MKILNVFFDILIIIFMNFHYSTLLENAVSREEMLNDGKNDSLVTLIEDIYQAVQCSNILISTEFPRMGQPQLNTTILGLDDTDYGPAILGEAFTFYLIKLTFLRLSYSDFILQKVTKQFIFWNVVNSTTDFNRKFSQNTCFLFYYNDKNYEQDYSIHSYKYNEIRSQWSVECRQIKLPLQFKSIHIPRLRIGVCQCPPIISTTDLDGIQVLEGYVADLVDALSATIKTKIEIVAAKDNQYGSLINRSWTGIMKLLVEQNADITFGIGHSHERRKYALFSMPYIRKPTRILYRGLSYEEWNYTFFLKPFQIRMWKSIVVVIALTLILITCAKTTKYELQGNTATASRIINTSFFFFALILLQCFISRLTAVFSIVKPKVPFQTFEEMVERQEYFPIIMKGYKEEEAFSTATIESWQLGWKLIEKNKPHSIVNNFEEGIEVVYKEKAGFITADMNIAKIIENNCSFTLAPFDFGEETGSFAYSLNFSHYRYFNNKVLELKEIGILSILNDRYLDKWEECAFNDDSFHPVLFGRVIGPILVFVNGLLLSVIFFFLELIIHKLWYV